jgi:hypothetical protein
MVSVVALLCAAGIARGDCSPENAIDVIHMSDAADELACMRDSMMTLAPPAIQAGPDEYWKIVCVRTQRSAPILVGERTDREGK